MALWVGELVSLWLGGCRKNQAALLLAVLLGCMWSYVEKIEIFVTKRREGENGMLPIELFY